MVKEKATEAHIKGTACDSDGTEDGEKIAAKKS